MASMASRVADDEFNRDISQVSNDLIRKRLKIEKKPTDLLTKIIIK